MRKKSRSYGARRRIGSDARTDAAREKQDLSDYDPSRYASSGEYRGAGAFGADRYRDRSDGGYAETAQQRAYSPTPNKADSYSVADSGARYAASSKRKRRRQRIVGGIVAAAAAVVIVFVGFLGGMNNALHEGLDSSLWGVLTKVNGDDPFYMLLMGTDESQDRQDDPELAGTFRTDTIILARVDPQQQALTLVSIPRDTKVDLGEYGEQKINAAHTFGGATLAVQAVEELTGVKISHYAEIDFDGFIGLVDTLGGIEVDVPMEIDDEDAGGHLDAGLQTLNSWQALILCRSRNSYEEAVGQGDLYRAANQRLVLAAIVNKVLESDPATMTSVINSCTQYVSTDLDVDEILALANEFGDFDSENKLYSATFPVTSEYSDDIWWDIAQQGEWEAMRERMDAGLSPSTEDVVDPTTGTVLATAGDSARGSVDDDDLGTHSGLVTVRNGSTHEGAAAAAGEALREMGFQTDVDNADSTDYPQTLVVYRESSQASEAQQIADVLKCDAPQRNDGSYAFDGDYLVVIGADWES